MRLLSHFLTVFLSAFFVLISSLLLEVFIQDPAVVLPQRMLAIGFVHLFIVFVALNVRTNTELDGRINPYITTVEWWVNIRMVEHVRNKREFPREAAYFVELLAQALAAVVASAVFYGLISSGSGYTFNTDPILSTGRAVTSAIMGSLLISWVYFHNYYYRQSYQLPFTVASALGIMSAITYPFLGVGTFNPFRALAKCVPSGTCTSADAGLWLLIVGPLVGIVAGYLLSLATRNVARDNKIH